MASRRPRHAGAGAPPAPSPAPPSSRLPTIEPRPSGRYHHGELKAALLAAGEHHLASQGAAALSLRELAKAAGVSHAAVYRHYADREALLADLATTGFRTLLALQRQTVATTDGGPAQQLTAIGRCYVRFGIERPNLIHLMFGPEIQQWRSHPDLLEAAQQLGALLDELVRAGQAAGQLRHGDPGELALAAWSIVHGLTQLLAGQRIPGMPEDPAFADHVARRCTDLLMEGLTPHDPRTPDGER